MSSLLLLNLKSIVQGTYINVVSALRLDYLPRNSSHTWKTTWQKNTCVQSVRRGTATSKCKNTLKGRKTTIFYWSIHTVFWYGLWFYYKIFQNDFYDFFSDIYWMSIIGRCTVMDNIFGNLFYCNFIQFQILRFH